MADINRLELLLKSCNLIGMTINAAFRRREAYPSLQMCFGMYVFVCRQLEFSLIDRFMCIDSQIKKFCTVSRQCYSCTHTDDAKNREN